MREVNWCDILDGNNADDDYNRFIVTFDDLYNECIPLKKIKSNRKKEPMSPWITKGLLKSINKKNKLSNISILLAKNDSKSSKLTKTN